MKNEVGSKEEVMGTTKPPPKSLFRTSKHGTTYYYVPYRLLTEEQKEQRRKLSRAYAKRTKLAAAAYRKEHNVGDTK